MKAIIVILITIKLCDSINSFHQQILLAVFQIHPGFDPYTPGPLPPPRVEPLILSPWSLPSNHCSLLSVSAPSCLTSLTLALPALLFAHITPYSLFHLLEVWTQKLLLASPQITDLPLTHTSIYICTQAHTHTHPLLFLLYFAFAQSAAAVAKSLQLRLTRCDPIDNSPGSSVPGILQARPLEWVAISFSNA